VRRGKKNIELCVPVIGYNSDPQSTVPMADVFQEAASFAFHCALTFEPETLTRVCGASASALS
jgi:hypothetical protein